MAVQRPRPQRLDRLLGQVMLVAITCAVVAVCLAIVVVSIRWML